MCLSGVIDFPQLMQIGWNGMSGPRAARSVGQGFKQGQGSAPQ